jgi:hypothetical protein
LTLNVNYEVNYEVSLRELQHRVLKLSQNALLSLLRLLHDLYRKELFVFQHIHIFQIKKSQKRKKNESLLIGLSKLHICFGIFNTHFFYRLNSFLSREK